MGRGRTEHFGKREGGEKRGASKGAMMREPGNNPG